MGAVHNQTQSGRTGIGRRPSGGPTRAESAQLDETVREVALQTFLDHGFHGTSMDAVARAVGITRRTLYARYEDKSALFRDAVQWAFARLELDDPVTLVDRDDLAGSLLAIATAAHRRATDPRLVRLSVLVATEFTRIPELAPRRYSLSKFPGMQQAVELLRHHADAGTIVADDLELAAEQLFAMVASHPARLAAFGLLYGADVADRRVERAVDLFLRGILVRTNES